jgi:hypothetical protein
LLGPDRERRHVPRIDPGRKPVSCSGLTIAAVTVEFAAAAITP